MILASARVTPARAATVTGAVRFTVLSIAVQLQDGQITAPIGASHPPSTWWTTRKRIEQPPPPSVCGHHFQWLWPCDGRQLCIWITWSQTRWGHVTGARDGAAEWGLAGIRRPGVGRICRRLCLVMFAVIHTSVRWSFWSCRNRVRWISVPDRWKPIPEDLCSWSWEYFKIRQPVDEDCVNVGSTSAPPNPSDCANKQNVVCYWQPALSLEHYGSTTVKPHKVQSGLCAYVMKWRRKLCVNIADKV